MAENTGSSPGGRGAQRFRLEVRLTERDVGERAVIRWRRPAGDSREEIADVLGVLEAADSGSLTIRTASGELVTIPRDRALAGKTIPPPPRDPSRKPENRKGVLTMVADVRVRRVYDEPSSQDGTRVLVDRVWPRGLRKDAARLDEWAKDVAPSTGLRTWYQHDPAKFAEFRRRYAVELKEPVPRDALARLRSEAATGPLTLLTATKEIDLSQAAVLADLLRHDG